MVLWINEHLINCLMMYRSHNQLYCLQQLTVILLEKHNDSHWSTHVVPTVEKWWHHKQRINYMILNLYAAKYSVWCHLKQTVITFKNYPLQNRLSWKCNRRITYSRFCNAIEVDINWYSLMLFYVMFVILSLHKTFNEGNQKKQNL